MNLHLSTRTYQVLCILCEEALDQVREHGFLYCRIDHAHLELVEAMNAATMEELRRQESTMNAQGAP